MKLPAWFLQPTHCSRRAVNVTRPFQPPASRFSFFHWDSSATALVRASSKPASKPETGPGKTSLLQTGSVTTETSTDHLVGRTTKGSEDPELDCFLKKGAWPGCPREAHAGPPLLTSAQCPQTSPAAVKGSKAAHTSAALPWHSSFVKVFSLLRLQLSGTCRKIRRNSIFF